MIDPNDFDILVEETFEELDRLIETNAVSGVDVYYDASACTFEFADISRVTLACDRASQRLDLRAEDGGARFYYHPVEEQWYDGETEESLTATIDGILSRKLGHPIRLVHQ